MKELVKVKNVAQELAEKKSWVLKGFVELFELMNSEVEEIESDFYIDVDTGVTREYCEITGGKLNYKLRFDTRTDAFFQMRIDEFSGNNWTTEKIYSLSYIHTSDIRQIAQVIPKLLEEIAEKIEGWDEKYNETKSKLENMIEKLKEGK